MLRAILVTALVPISIDAHAVLTSPTPRQASGMIGVGTKLQPFEEAPILDCES